MTVIAMIGLGRMGANMARRLARAGLVVHGHDAAPGAREALKDEPGVHTHASLEDALGAMRAAHGGRPGARSRCTADGPPPAAPPAPGVLLVSVLTDIEVALARLAALGLGGTPRRIEVHGIAMATVRDPDGVLVELVHDAAADNLDALRR